MFKHKKFLPLIVAVLALAGCGGIDDSSDKDPVTSVPASSETSTDGSTSTPTPDPGGRPRIKLSVWGPLEEKPVYEALAAKFAVEYEEYVDFSIRYGEMGEDNAATEVLGDVDVAADLFMFADDQFAQLAQKGVLSELPAAYANKVSARDTDSAISAATFKNHEGEDALFAFPVTADNGYFLIYNNEYYTEEDVKTLDGILAKVTEDHNFVLDLGNGYYAMSFLMDMETITYDFDTELHSTTFNTPEAVDAVDGAIDAIRPLYNKGFLSEDFNDAALNDLKDEEDNYVVAAVTGNWNIELLKENLGDKLGATKLPTFKPRSWKEGDPEIQMGAFAGSKLLGVKSSTPHKDWALLFADYITDEAGQLERYTIRGGGTSNLALLDSEVFAEEPGLRALAEQAPYAIPQGKSVGGKFWDAASAVGNFILEEPEAEDDRYGMTTQQVLDAFVDALTK
ncbi:MAG TPA: extracellular solute-binding protein [Bacilli bacterium]|nr:extracellular solute-binding protein [Bacilli bacterium]